MRDAGSGSTSKRDFRMSITALRMAAVCGGVGEGPGHVGEVGLALGRGRVEGGEGGRGMECAGEGEVVVANQLADAARAGV